MSDTATRIVDAVIARDGLKLPADEYERLVRIYREIQPELDQIRQSEYRYVEPATLAPA